MKKTKIVCTIGPKTESEEMLSKMLDAGMNVMRLNFSHGDYAEHGQRIQNLRNVMSKTGKKAAILLDTKGPEIRTIKLEGGNDVSLKAGQTFTFTTDKSVVGNNEIVAVTYEGFTSDLSVGNTVLVDDGLIGMEVTAIEGNKVICKVLNNGDLGENKGVNLPGVSIALPALAEKDKQDLIFGCEQGVDFVAASFIRKRSDVVEIREHLKAHGGENIQIISKIENQQGIDNLDEIVEASYGVMVARGDLGVELPAEAIPNAQRRIVERCIAAKRPVIIATQMLYSMVRSPRPTRAEVSDVASAIYERVDAVMLSDETAMGDYPVEAVSTMSRVAREIEKDETHFTPMIDMNMVSVNHEITAQLARSAVRASTNLPIRYVVLDTATGRTGRYLAAFRGRCQVLAVCYTRHAQRILALSYGVVPILREQQSHERYQDRYHFVIDALDFIQRKHAIEPTDLLAVVGGSFDSKYGASYLEISSAERFRERDAVCDGC